MTGEYKTKETAPVTTHPGDAQALIDAVRESSEPTEIGLDNQGDVLVLHRGQTVVSLKPYKDALRTRPERKVGTATLTTLDSFITHVNASKGASSAVFASPAELVAVYDYHGTEPAFCQHRGVYEFPVSDEWRAWTRVNGESLPQHTFAEFIESHITDVATPKDSDAATYFAELGFTLASPSALLALSRGLRVRVEQEAVSRPNLSTGELEVSFKEQHTTDVGAPLKVPGGFVLHIAPHVCGARYAVPVRLRYRVANGKVLWTMILHRIELVLRDALDDAVKKVAEQTDLPVYHGSPEA